MAWTSERTFKKQTGFSCSFSYSCCFESRARTTGKEGGIWIRRTLVQIYKNQKKKKRSKVGSEIGRNSCTIQRCSVRSGVQYESVLGRVNRSGREPCNNKSHLPGEDTKTIALLGMLGVQGHPQNTHIFTNTHSHTHTTNTNCRQHLPGMKQFI